MRKITSPTHALVKHWRQLRISKSARRASKTVMLFGQDATLELGKDLKVTAFFSTQKEALFPHLSDEERFHITSAIWKKISGLNSDEGMGIEVSFDVPSFDEAVRKKEGRFSNRLLVLDEVSDPGNVGTLIRSAAAFGFRSVFLMPGCADPFNDKALRASKGLALNLEIIEGSYEQCLALIEKRGYFPIAADAKGKKVALSERANPAKGKKACALIMGNEARGVNPALLQKSFSVAIPMEKEVESLNVAAAGSLLMWLTRSA